MSTLLNNKAACLQKNGDYKSCINECNSGLEVLNSIVENNQSLSEEYRGQRIKFIFKKAHSLELLEKYKDALAEYETLMRLDSTYQNVQINYNRIKKMLIDSGEIKAVKQEVKTKPIESNVSGEKLAQKEEISNKKEEPKKEESPSTSVDKTKQYEEYKLKGNDFVKANDYENALNFYNKCIEIDSSNPIAYLNRSLCFIKLNKPDQAISDCTFVLSKESKNVKALYRRSNANKIKKLYNLVADDLKLLLSIEPNNQIAINEYESIKKFVTQNPLPAEKKIEIIDDKKRETDSTNNKNDKPAQKTINKDAKSQVFEQPKFKPKKTEDFSNVTNAYEFLQVKLKILS